MLLPRCWSSRRDSVSSTNRQRYALAIERFEQALEAGMPVERAVTETLRLELIAACALGDKDRVRGTLRRYGEHPLVPPAQRGYVASLAKRCLRGP